jgi:hypothetical protein
LNLGELEMSVLAKWAVMVAAALGSLLAVMASPVSAEVSDYEFQLVQNEVKKSEGAIVSVRLINKRSGKAVPDAVISAKRIDMAPDGMAEMATRIEQLPSTEAGIYRFKTNLSMAGRWQLSLAAKVQGEVGTVESKLVLKVSP